VSVSLCVGGGGVEENLCVVGSASVHVRTVSNKLPFHVGASKQASKQTMPNIVMMAL